jgi:C-terminal processing protease CtpA/Prc
VLVRSLPNGWRFRLPNEVYLTGDGKEFDATGVPPDICVRFLTPEDLRNDRDPALEDALKLLE